MQHLAYQPLFPTGNKYLQQKWDKASYDTHRRKVKSAKPTINTTPPRTYGHLTLKMKKQQLEEEQMVKIKRENNMLLEKISHTMRTTGRIDNRNYYESKSIGGERQQQELLRITKENQLILFRLSQCRPHYRVRDWDEGWLKTLKVMDSIARYPRGVASGQKGQGQTSGRSSDYDTKKESSLGATGQSSESSIANGNVQHGGEEEEEEEETARQEEAGKHKAPSPAAAEKSTSSDTSPPDPTGHTSNEDPDSTLSDTSERPNPPHIVPHTSMPSSPRSSPTSTTLERP